MCIRGRMQKYQRKNQGLGGELKSVTSFSSEYTRTICPPPPNTTFPCVISSTKSLKLCPSSRYSSHDQAQLGYIEVVHISLQCRHRKGADREDTCWERFSLPLMHLPSQLQQVLLPHLRRGDPQEQQDLSGIPRCPSLHDLSEWTEISGGVTKICQQILQNIFYWCYQCEPAQTAGVDLKASIEHFAASMKSIDYYNQ